MLVLMALWVIKVFVLFKNKTSFIGILNTLETGIFAPNFHRGGALEDELVSKCITYTTKQSLAYWIFAVGVIFFGMLSSLLTRIKSDNSKDWETPMIPFALFEIKTTTIFMIIYCYQSISISVFAVIISSIDLCIVSVIAHIKTQFIILKNVIRNINNDAVSSKELLNRGLAIAMDAKEVEKFMSLADVWWDMESPIKYLHSMNKLRIPFMLNCLKSIGFLKKDDENASVPLKNVNILDVGCGCGIMSEPLSRLGANVTGVDGVPEMIQCAKDHAALDKDLKELKYFTEPIQTFAAKNKEKFDIVVASELLEHVTDKAGVVKASVQCLKPEGSIFITTESKSLLSKWITIDWLEFIGAIPKGGHELEMYITPKETQKLLEENNCTVKSVRGTFYNPYAGKWYFSPFITWYIMHAVKNKSTE